LGKKKEKGQAKEETLSARSMSSMGTVTLKTPDSGVDERDGDSSPIKLFVEP
jgi:hypothetical protein